jgi:hypothetical protein
MPMITSSSASAPFSASSLPTCGPTNSTRRSWPRRFGVELERPSPFADLGRVLLGLERQADQHVRLEPKFCTARRCSRPCQPSRILLEIGGACA